MSTSLWISTAYLQQPPSSDQFVALLAFADSRETFEQLVKTTFNTQKAHYYYQLAPLKAEVFFQRHGQIWLAYQANGLKEGEVRVVELVGEKPKEQFATETNYLLCHQINNVKLLDRQFGRHPKVFAPDEIFKLLFPNTPIPPDITQPGWSENWQEPTFLMPVLDKKTLEKDTALFGEPLPELKCYFILDANKHKYLEPENFHCRIESLFQGEFAEITKDIAPYLVEVIPYPDDSSESELMGLFSDEGAMTRFNWHEELGIFIHSRYDFDTVLRHLRHFPVMKDENGKWFFFRFYDPKVLRNYLEVIATSPEKLNKFFGYEKRIIHAFASGIGDNFHYYQLKALPEDTRSIPILLTEFEVNGFKDKKWLETREYLMEYALQEYPQLYSEENKNVLIKNLDEGFDKGYTYNIAILQYVVAKQSAVKNNIDFATLETQLKYTISTPLERAQELFAALGLK
ncbi:hypothetical protein HMPREF9953_2083 [Haemophilus parainfluenzae ATCC 33392]|uniref:DUF4123 domain-containing protein n=1 Tax=Haemophilus parainfluenzae ATCC 33392 TaxID=888828 RepID=A0ABD7ZG58_HAEPA|nr:DUF4123 domain-containing protein [Haemophilus parainfluenzae]EGC71340.1 hypothetical protein HMPREF9417_1668 [Haemophilus parainfluenzae ATCC 33392]KFL98964.1 hypothetical protein HMPREF9953_2083 [Haemophilus parainfluenzae ATCC 33392]QQB22329.1 DUF4123 domain-containing protein [Haemophilus parainfluenzae]WMS23977.1 DUF4123 domain-containing protein [Haemophilus parainfluenzae ATCC 33392]STO95322.1 Uncharacterised protein [Haemophilus parainfluenzae ATCC 33392]